MRFSANLFRRIPLADNYWAAVALALLALCPYLILTTATSLAQPVLMRELDATRFELQLTEAMSNAGYAFGAVACADLVQRLAPRHVYFFCEAGFVVSAILAVGAPGIGLYMAGVILQGVFTGMLLVAALPPLILGHGTNRIPTTATVILLGVFGMVTAGPLVGGLVGSYNGWRLLYSSIAVLAAVGLTVGALTFGGNEPPARRTAFDWTAIPPAFGVTFLPFFGVAWLTRRTDYASPLFLIPVIVGLLLGILLLLCQFRRADPLVPVRPISSTLPLTGTLGAMLVGAAFTTLLELSEIYMLDVSGFSPVRAGVLIAPQILGVVIATLLFHRLVSTIWTPFLALSGLVSLGAGGGVLLAVTPSNAEGLIPVAALFLGYGAGAGVVPGLFLAAFSIPAIKIAPTFALIELLRSQAAFLIGPVLLQIAMTTGTNLMDGFRIAVVIVLVMVVAGALFLIGVWILGGARSNAPDLEGWVTGTSTGYHSPRLGARIRRFR